MDFLPPLLEDLAPEHRDEALEVFERLIALDGMVLIEEAEPDTSLVLVCQGKLEIRTGDVVLGSAEVGEMVGEMGLFGGEIRSASVVAVGDTTLLALGRRGYERLRGSGNPVVASIEHASLMELTERLRTTSDRVAGLAEGTSVEHLTPAPGFFARIATMFGAGGIGAPPQVDAAVALARSSLFSEVPLPVLSKVASSFETVAAQEGHFFCTEGSVGDEMFLVVTGHVDVVVNTEGERVELVGTLEPGEAFGMCSLLESDRQRMASCVATGPVVALSMSRSAWAEVVNRPDAVGSAVRVAAIRALSGQLSYANAQLALLDATSPAEQVLVRASGALEAHGVGVTGEHRLPGR